MACTVHCLVSEIQELLPLVKRIAQAGIDENKVYVVVRRPHSQPGPEEDGLAWQTWGELFVPAAWWWSFAAEVWGPLPGKPCQAAEVFPIPEGDSRVVGMALHRRRRKIRQD